MSEAVTSSPEETAALAGTLARSLGPGAILLLEGTLGAGKTAFVRGLAAGLGADADDVSSPTFTLVQEYAGGRLTLFHVDLYRLSPAEADDLGLDELAASGGVLAIEWPERLSRPWADAMTVRLAVVGEGQRRITITDGRTR